MNQMLENLVCINQVEGFRQVQFHDIALHKPDIALLVAAPGILQEFRPQIHRDDMVI